MAPSSRTRSQSSLDVIHGNFFPMIILVIWLAGYFFMYRDLKKEAAAKKLADADNEVADIATE